MDVVWYCFPQEFSSVVPDPQPIQQLNSTGVVLGNSVSPDNLPLMNLRPWP